MGVRSYEKHDFEITDGGVVSHFAQKKENKIAHILEDGVDCLRSMEDYRIGHINSYGGGCGRFIYYFQVDF